MVAMPSPPAPRQPMSSQDRGERERRKPRRAKGVGLPKVLRSSPLTSFWGLR